MNIEDINNPDDPRVNDFRNLSDSDRRPDLPGGKGLVIAEGVVVVQRMLTSRFPIRSILGTASRLQQLRTDLEATNIPCYRTTAEIMAQIVGFHLNRGVLAAAARPEELCFETTLQSCNTVAILEGINDHENLGSLFRNAAGLGIDAIIFGPRCADPLYRRSIRVSMGHVLLVPYVHTRQWPEDLHVLQQQGFHLCAMTPRKDAPSLAHIRNHISTKRVGFLLGAEGPGLSYEALQCSDTLVRIPMTRNTDSLNVATAAAIAFYEWSNHHHMYEDNNAAY